MKLDKTNVLEYAWENYKNPQMFHGDEFFADMKIFYYLKKLLTRYIQGKSDNHRLALNHIITLNNIFGPKATVNLLRYYIPEKYYTELNSFLMFLSIIPLSETNVKVDEKILKRLRDL